MNKKSKEYKNLVHNCALVYNAVPMDVYMKFHANVNASNSSDISYHQYDEASDVIDFAFNWSKTNEGYDYWQYLWMGLLS